MILKLKYNIFIALLCTKEYCADIAFRHIKFNTKSIFTQTKKYWTAYLDVFINRKLLNQGKLHTNLLLQYKRLPLTNNFLKLANSLTSSHFSKDVQNVLSSLIKRATGQIHLYSHVSTKESYAIKFHIEEKLSLNITFLILRFFRDFKHCRDTGLTVESSHGTREYTYCKHYASFSLYPKFNPLEIRFIKYYMVGYVLPFELSIKYSVLDNGIVATEYLKDLQLQLHAFTTIFFCYTFSGKHPILSYLIDVSKNFQIKVFSLYSELIVIFDGPGFIFPFIKTNNQYYTTSSFQCVVQYYKKSRNIKLDGLFAFSAFEKHPSIFLNIKERHLAFDFPASSCTSILCIIEVTAQDKYQVNFTVSNISTLETGCLFWGLVTIDPGDENPESQRLCQSITNSPSRSFYSVQSILFIVMYNYLKMANIHISGSLCETKCKPVYLDTCSFDMLNLNSLKEANSYLSDISSDTNLILMVNKLVSIYTEGDIFLHVSKDNCAIIQMGNRAVEELAQLEAIYRVCQVHFSPLTTYHFISDLKGEIRKAE